MANRIQLSLKIARPQETFAPCKGIWIPKSRKILLVDSGISEFGIRNPSSIDKESRIQRLELLVGIITFTF